MRLSMCTYVGGGGKKYNASLSLLNFEYQGGNYKLTRHLTCLSLQLRANDEVLEQRAGEEAFLFGSE